MTTNEPPSYPGDSGPDDTTPPAGSGESGTSDLPSYGSVPPPEGAPPPPPPPPPSAPGGSAEGFSAPDAISWGWGKFRENVGQSILAAVILVVVSVVLSVVGTAIAPGGGAVGGGTLTDLDIGSFIVSVIVSALSFIVTVAISRATLDVTDGARLDIGAGFGKVDVTNALLAGLIVGALTQVGFVLFYLPGIIVTFFAYFTSYFVAEGSSAVDGIQKSFSLVAANLGDALLLAILSILVAILGVLALCVGIFVAIPVTFLAAGYAFRRFNGQPVQPVATS